jgi:hypothetical protein
MKKFLIILLLLFLVSPVFAKTVQCVKKYQVQADSYSTYDVTPAIQSMINMGWRVVSITPVTVRSVYSNPTDYVIVLFEMEESK